MSEPPNKNVINTNNIVIIKVFLKELVLNAIITIRMATTGLINKLIMFGKNGDMTAIKVPKTELKKIRVFDVLTFAN